LRTAPDYFNRPRTRNPKRASNPEPRIRDSEP
jgi:hypothetical protein